MRNFCPKTSIYMILILLVFGAGFVFAGDLEKSITAWKEWKNIDAAIALRPLDGPEDILEKVEIIQDRIDELEREKIRLDKEMEVNHQKLENLRNQREVLYDIAEIKQGRDSQTRQRLNDLAERIRMEEKLIKLRRQSSLELEKEFTRMKKMANDYREKARLLKLEEGGKE